MGVRASWAKQATSARGVLRLSGRRGFAVAALASGGAAAGGLASLVSRAGTVVWNGAASAYWDDVNQWTGGVPTGADGVYVDNGKAAASQAQVRNNSSAAAGTLTIDANDSVLVNQSATLAVGGNVTTNGMFQVWYGGAATVGGDIAVGGTLQLNYNSSSGFGVTPLTVGGALSGTGTIALNTIPITNHVDVAHPSGSPLQIGAGLLVTGGGTLLADDIVNNGQFAPSTNQLHGGFALVGRNSVTNNGVMGGGNVNGPMMLDAPTIINNGTITGEILFGRTGFIANQPAAQQVTNNGTIVVGNGPAVVSQQVVLTSPGTIQFASGGELTVHGGLNAPGGLTVPVGASLGGTGTVTANVTVAGKLDMFEGGVSPTHFDIVGDLTLAGGAHLDEGPLWSGTNTTVTRVTGDVDLSSSADYLDLPLNSPSVYTFPVMMYTGTLTGVFDHVTPGYAVSYDTPGVITVTSSPEPGAVTGLAFTAAAAVMQRRRRRGMLRQGDLFIGSARALHRSPLTPLPRGPG